MTEPDPPDVATARRVLKVVGSLRTTVGTLALIAPGRFGAAWIGADGRRPGVRVLARAVGIREIVVGAGAITAANEGRHLRRWTELGLVVDAGDAVATLLSARRLPAGRAAGTLVLALAGVAAGTWLLSTLPEEVPEEASR